MKKIFLIIILLFYYCSGESKDYKKDIIKSVLKNFINKENITNNDDIYIYSTWYIEDEIKSLQFNFLKIIPDSLDKKIVFIEQPVVIEDKVAIGIGYIDKISNKTNQIYYLFKYKPSLCTYKLIDILDNISQKWNDALYIEIIKKLIREKYKQGDTIYVKLFYDTKLPEIIEGNVVINLSNKEKSDKWYKNYFASTNSKPFYLNEIFPIIKNTIQIKVRKKNIVGYDEEWKNPICFIVATKFWDVYLYRVKYYANKNGFEIKKIKE
jgi:hypothetical protein